MFKFEETLNGLIVVVLVVFILVMGLLMFAGAPPDEPLVDIYCLDLKTKESEWKYLPNLQHQGGDLYLEYTQRGEVLKYRCGEPE